MSTTANVTTTEPLDYPVRESIAVTDAVPEPDTDSKPAAAPRRLIESVIWSWAGHAVFIATGFLMPRFMDRHLGQASLGIWDFGWSIVSYFGLAQIGIGSSVNRYVAKHRTNNDVAALRRTVSSVNCFQTVAGFSMLVATALLVWQFPALFGSRLGARTADARWILAFLGTALAVETSFDAFRGVITGCHRWDLHNGINSAEQAVTTIAMMGAILAGGGLPALAFVYLMGVVIAEIVRMTVAFRVCPELQLRWRDVSISEIRTLVVFGMKALVDGLSRLLLYQANNILVVGHLGAVVLAVYARGLALIRHTEVMTSKLAFVVTPAASALKSRGTPEELRQLLFDSTKYGAFVALPLLVYLALFGDLVVQVWMGPGYGDGWVLTILAMGSLIPLLQRPAQQFLVGLNYHGRVGLASLIVAVIGVATAWAMTGPLHMGLIGAALAISIPLSLDGVFIAVYVCYKLKIRLLDYLAVLRTPVACVAPFALVLAAVRAFSDDDASALVTLVVGTVLAGLVLVPCYWLWALPPRMRHVATTRFQALVPRMLRASPPTA